VRKITANIYLEEGFPNAGVIVTSEGVILIDTPMYPSKASELKEKLKEFGPLLYLVNTDHHLDHILCNSLFDIPVIGHNKTREKFPTDDSLLKQPLEDPKEAVFIDQLKVKPPTITFSECLTLYLGEHTIQMFPLVGHTENTLAIYVPEEKVLFSGDNISDSTLFFAEGYTSQWIDSLKKIKEMEVNTFIGGHIAPIEDKGELDKQIDYIQKVRDTVLKAIENDLSKDEAISQVEKFSDRPEENGGGIGRVYDRLKEEQK